MIEKLNIENEQRILDKEQHTRTEQRRLQLETEIDQLRRRIEYNQEVLEKRDKEIGNLERQLQRAKSDSRTAESELRHLREIDENSSKIRYFKMWIFGASTRNLYFRSINSKPKFSVYRLEIMDNENFGESAFNINLATMFSNWKMKNGN